MQHLLAKCGQASVIRDGKALAALKPTPIFAIDIETHGYNKRVGDCAASSSHGICGIAICNTEGDAGYIVVNDHRDYQALDIAYVIEFLNKNWFKKGCAAVLHNCKFDLGFLMSRGLKIDEVRIRDTFIVKNILNQGLYTSNALKDIVRERFNIETNSEVAIKEWLKANGTQDYGDIPPELMGPYACDDVRYTLALAFNLRALDEEEKRRHDLYVRNSLHLNAAEVKGICINLPLMKERLTVVQERMSRRRDELKHMFGATKIDLDNEQQMLQLLHHESMHPGPRDYYGERRYVLDDEFLRSVPHDKAVAYRDFAKLQAFQQSFSALHGGLDGRVLTAGNDIGFYPSFLASYHSKGGLALAKKPDFTDGVKLRREIRELFIPRNGCRFIVVRAQDLATQLLAYYCNDAELSAEIGKGGDYLCNYLSGRNGFGPVASSLLLRRVIEGSGYGVLEQRLKIAGVKLKKGYNPKTLHTQFEAKLHGFIEMQNRLLQAFRGEGFVRDRVGATVRVPEDRMYRAHSVLLASSLGNISSLYFDLFVRALASVGAHLVFAHNGEWLFETARAMHDTIPEQVISKIAVEQVLATPTPKFIMSAGATNGVWECAAVDAQDVVTSTWF